MTRSRRIDGVRHGSASFGRPVAWASNASISAGVGIAVLHMSRDATIAPGRVAALPRTSTDRARRQEPGGERRRERVAGADPAQDVDRDAGHRVAPAGVISETPSRPCLSTMSVGPGPSTATSGRRPTAANSSSLPMRMSLRAGGAGDEGGRLGRRRPEHRPPVEVEDRHRERPARGGRRAAPRGARASSTGPAPRRAATRRR